MKYTPQIKAILLTILAETFAQPTDWRQILKAPRASSTGILTIFLPRK
jgi:hypothetical protein